MNIIGCVVALIMNVTI